MTISFFPPCSIKIAAHNQEQDLQSRLQLQRTFSASIGSLEASCQQKYGTASNVYGQLEYIIGKSEGLQDIIIHMIVFRTGL